MSLVSARNNFTRIVREVEGGTQVLVTKDRHPAVRIIAEEEYQQMMRQLAVDDLIRMRREWLAAGITGEELIEAVQEARDSRP